MKLFPLLALLPCLSIDHFAHNILSAFKTCINFEFRDSNCMSVQISLMKLHKFPLTFVFLYVNFSHVIPHKLFNVDVFISGAFSDV